MQKANVNSDREWEICIVLLANVLGRVDVAVLQDKTCSSGKLPHHGQSFFASSRDHTRPPRLSFALPMILTMNARGLQRAHHLRGI